MEYPVPDIYYSLSCAMYIATSMTCAAIRWFHVCRPYSGTQLAEYYPARPWITFFFAMLALTFPYAVRPMDEGTWLYVLCFGILYYPLGCCIVMRKYFRIETIQGYFFAAVYFFLSLGFIAAMLVTLLTGNGNLFVRHSGQMLWGVGLVGLFLTVRMVYIAMWMLRRIRIYHRQNFSDEDDFPYLFASRILWAPIVLCICAWAIFLTQSRWLCMWFNVFGMVWTVFFTCSVLHPNMPVKVLFDDVYAETEDDTLDDKTSSGVGNVVLENSSTEPTIEQPVAARFDTDDIRRELFDIVLRKYTYPHLKRTDVINEMMPGRKRIAGDMISEYGFYNLVNAFRLRHYELYQKRFPHETQESAAMASGFKSRYALIHARKQLKDFDTQPIERFLPKDI